MNERLTQLAKQAQVEHCISHVRLQEFAELIVRECIDVYNDDGYQTDAVSDNRVLKHFGNDDD